MSSLAFSNLNSKIWENHSLPLPDRNDVVIITITLITPTICWALIIHRALSILYILFNYLHTLCRCFLGIFIFDMRKPRLRDINWWSKVTNLAVAYLGFRSCLMCEVSSHQPHLDAHNLSEVIPWAGGRGHPCWIPSVLPLQPILTVKKAWRRRQDALCKCKQEWTSPLCLVLRKLGQ